MSQWDQKSHRHIWRFSYHFSPFSCHGWILAWQSVYINDRDKVNFFHAEFLFLLNTNKFTFSRHNCSCICAQLHLTLCNPMDCSPPGSFVHGILQARILERVATLSSRGSPWCRDRALRSCVSCITGKIFTQWANWEAHTCSCVDFMTKSGQGNGMHLFQEWLLQPPRYPLHSVSSSFSGSLQIIHWKTRTNRE